MRTDKMQLIENQTIHKKSYSEIPLKHHTVCNTTFEGCDFTGCDLTSSRFSDCRFKGCNLSLAKIDGCRFQSVEFESCKLVGVDFTKCDKMFLSLAFRQCLIGSSNFSDLDLKNTLFSKCVIKETFFTGTNLTGANFAESDLMGSTFHNTNLTKANFIGALNYSINPLTNKLSKAKFSNPEVLSLLHGLGIIIE
ncbi:MAG: pentapeptide repeat-containing protein [Parachlamydiales bacterium]|nr:pentapeptide repeat-containing protein [Verrucomicrobiota bacterium]MBX3718311.1 pentapeptide repeat-containing protein [Candidatus Acheromyda pituitae]